MESEEYIVCETVPEFGLKPMLYILVGDKRCGVPVRLELQPGDVIMIDRSARQNETDVNK